VLQCVVVVLQCVAVVLHHTSRARDKPSAAAPDSSPITCEVIASTRCRSLLLCCSVLQLCCSVFAGHSVDTLPLSTTVLQWVAVVLQCVAGHSVDTLPLSTTVLQWVAVGCRELQ